MGRPAIVLADEPTGNLDSKSSEDIVDLLRELHAEGITLVVITHNREIAEQLPRRIALRDGVVESDTAGRVA
jgi:putative ABC transport system ATP-binding protein